MNTGRSGRSRLVILVATRKGAWIYHGDPERRGWRVDGPYFLGHVISHMVLDPRDGRTLLAAAKTGHLGPTIFRSTDLGQTWQEAKLPPAFGPGRNGLAGRSVDHTFWLTPTNADERRRDRCLVRRNVAAGTVPQRGRWPDLGAFLVHQR